MNAPTIMFAFLYFGKPEWRRCTGCGMSVHRESVDRHLCPPERAAAHLIPLLLDEISDWLETSTGRFEQFYAERAR